MSKNKEVKNLLKEANKIVFITGSGVSTDSGIPDFKTTDKNWVHEISRSDSFSVIYFKNEPESFWKIFKETLMWEGKKPNSFHRLPEFLASKSKEVHVLTQNIDGLHGVSKAFIKGNRIINDTQLINSGNLESYSGNDFFGSLRIIEAHGNASRVICPNYSCVNVKKLSEVIDETLPTCEKCESVLKPDVSLFMEGVNGFSETRDAILSCDVLIVAGTSLTIGPVNELPHYIDFDSSNLGFEGYSKKEDRNSIWVNFDEAPDEYTFDYQWIGNTTDFAEMIMKE